MKDVFLKVLTSTEQLLVKELTEKTGLPSTRTEAEQIEHDTKLLACQDYLQKTMVELMGRYAESVTAYVRRSKGKKKATEAATKAKEIAAAARMALGVVDANYRSADEQEAEGGAAKGKKRAGGAKKGQQAAAAALDAMEIS